MWCLKVQRLLSDYLTRGVTEKVKIGLENHLEKCPHCTRYYEELKKTEELLIGIREEEPPSPDYWNNYWPNLKEKLQEQFPAIRERPRLRILPRLRWAFEGALAVLLIVVLALHLEQRKSLKIPPVSSRDSFSQEIRIFREAEEMFPDSIQWMLVNGRRIDLKLARDKKAPLKTEEPLLIFDFKIVRSESPFSWQTLSSPRILVFNREEVKTEFYDELNGKTVVYRYRLLPEITERGKVWARVEFSLLPHRKERDILRQGLYFNTVVLLEGNKPCQLGRLRGADAEYLIYLTAYPGTKKFPVRDSRGDLI